MNEFNWEDDLLASDDELFDSELDREEWLMSAEADEFEQWANDGVEDWLENQG